MGKVMGIDYGAKRVGVSLSDVSKSFAFAKGVYENNDSLLNKIAKLADDDGVETIVIGESDNPVGGLNTIMRRISIFSEAVKLRTGLPVEQVGEAYSSAEAKRALETKIKTRKDTNVPVDAAAAAIILQTYLDSLKHSG